MGIGSNNPVDDIDRLRAIGRSNPPDPDAEILARRTGRLEDLYTGRLAGQDFGSRDNRAFADVAGADRRNGGSDISFPLRSIAYDHDLVEGAVGGGQLDINDVPAADRYFLRYIPDIREQQGGAVFRRNGILSLAIGCCSRAAAPYLDAYARQWFVLSPVTVPVIRMA